MGAWSPLVLCRSVQGPAFDECLRRQVRDRTCHITQIEGAISRDDGLCGVGLVRYGLSRVHGRRNWLKAVYLCLWAFWGVAGNADREGGKHEWQDSISR